MMDCLDYIQPLEYIHMDTYTVTITEHPLGITFIATGRNGTGDLIALHDVTPNSLGAQLGLCIGDQLVAINGQSVCNLTIAEINKLYQKQVQSLISIALYTLRIAQTLPFSATLSKHRKHTALAEAKSSGSCRSLDALYDADEDQSTGDDRYVQLNSLCSSRTEDTLGPLKLTPIPRSEFQRILLMYIIHR